MDILSCILKTWHSFELESQKLREQWRLALSSYPIKDGWMEQCFTSTPRQHSIGYMGDGLPPSNPAYVKANVVDQRTCQFRVCSNFRWLWSVSVYFPVTQTFISSTWRRVVGPTVTTTCYHWWCVTCRPIMWGGRYNSSWNIRPDRVTDVWLDHGVRDIWIGEVYWSAISSPPNW